MNTGRTFNRARKAAAFVLSCGGAAALIAGSTTPASAAPPQPAVIVPAPGPGDVRYTGYICFYDNFHYSARSFIDHTVNGYCPMWNVGNMGYDDRFSSIINEPFSS